MAADSPVLVLKYAIPVTLKAWMHSASLRHLWGAGLWVRFIITFLTPCVLTIALVIWPTKCIQPVIHDAHA
jgi:uncharacterized membrane protein YjjP (DUF1212 family)